LSLKTHPKTRRIFPRVNLLLLMLGVMGVGAQKWDLALQMPEFSHINTTQGLSHNDIYCIYQDKKGILWVGAEDGLNAFNGYESQIMVHEPSNPTSLSNSNISAICEDKTGQLWVGTKNG